MGVTPGRWKQRPRPASERSPAPPDVLRSVLRDLVEPHDRDVDQALDVATSCLARHGVAHTSVPLLAKYLGVSRAKVYSQFGSVQQMARMILIRDLTRFIDTLPEECFAPGPDGVIATSAAAVRFGREHSIITKVISDEPAVIAEMLPHAEILAAVTRRPLATYLRSAMEAGVLRDGDAEAIADLVTRLVVTSVVLAPPSDVATYLRGVLGPLLTP